MNSQKFARSLIESRKHLDKSFSIPKSNGIETSSDLPLPQLLVLHREMQDRLIQGSFIPSNISEQYHFEEKNGLREVEVHNFTSNQVHLFLDMAASKIRVSSYYYFPFFLVCLILV